VRTGFQMQRCLNWCTAIITSYMHVRNLNMSSLVEPDRRVLGCVSAYILRNHIVSAPSEFAPMLISELYSRFSIHQSVWNYGVLNLRIVKNSTKSVVEFHPFRIFSSDRSATSSLRSPSVSASLHHQRIALRIRLDRSLTGPR